MDPFDSLVDLVSSSPWTYAVILAIAAIDALIPLVPSEATVIAAGVLAGAGELELGLVIAAGAAGAHTGGTAAHWLRRAPGSPKAPFVFSGVGGGGPPAPRGAADLRRALRTRRTHRHNHHGGCREDAVGGLRCLRGGCRHRVGYVLQPRRLHRRPRVPGELALGPPHRLRVRGGLLCGDRGGAPDPRPTGRASGSGFGPQRLEPANEDVEPELEQIVWTSP